MAAKKKRLVVDASSESKILTPTARWSPQQEAVFAAIANRANKTIIVEALAGTGKTTTSVEALRRTSPDLRVLACAFNKTIAVELSERLADSPHVTCQTLHSYGFRLAANALSPVKIQPENRCAVERAKFTAGSFVPGDQVTKIAYPASTLVEKFSECSIEGWRATEQKRIEILEALVRRFNVEIPKGFEEQTIATASDVINSLVETVQHSGMCSFSDMLALPLAMDLHDASFDIVLVDEAQDMSPAQLELARRAVKPDGQLVFVGDSNQAIYDFRGADSTVLINAASVEGSIKLPLTVTRRCGKSIVKEAQRLVPAFEAPVDAPEGIVHSMPFTELINAASPGDFIVSRRNAPMASLALKFLAAGKRVEIVGRKNLGADLLKLINRSGGKNRAASIGQILNRARYYTTIEVHNATIAEREGLAQIAEDRFAAIHALSEGITTAGALTDRIEKLLSPAGDDDGAGDQSKIRISSVHRAKGLEAERVFVLVDTLYWGQKSKFGHVAEERNIEYVALTRAKNQLLLVKGLS